MGYNQVNNRVRVDSYKTRNRDTFSGSLAALVLALGSGKCRSEIHAWQTGTSDTNLFDQRCSCTHHPAFFSRISWPKRVQTVWPQWLYQPWPQLWIGPSSLTGPSFRLEHCATIWTGPQTSGRIRKWSLSPLGKVSTKTRHLPLSPLGSSRL